MAPARRGMPHAQVAASPAGGGSVGGGGAATAAIGRRCRSVRVRVQCSSEFPQAIASAARADSAAAQCCGAPFAALQPAARFKLLSVSRCVDGRTDRLLPMLSRSTQNSTAQSAISAAGQRCDRAENVRGSRLGHPAMPCDHAAARPPPQSRRRRHSLPACCCSLCPTSHAGSLQHQLYNSISHSAHYAHITQPDITQSRAWRPALPLGRAARATGGAARCRGVWRPLGSGPGQPERGPPGWRT